MSHYRIAIVANFRQTEDCVPWNAYQELKLQGHAVEMIERGRFPGLVTKDVLDEEELRPFVEVFQPDYISYRDETADQILDALADAPAHEGEAPRHFVVEGYVGRDNFGDEFLFKTICERLRSVWPGCCISLIGENPRASLARHGVSGTTASQKGQVNALLNGASALIFMGGVIMDRPMERQTAGLIAPFVNPGPQLPGQTALCELAYLNHTPVVYLGAGAGPLSNPDAQRMVQLGSLTRPHYIMRDEESVRLLRESGVDGSLVSRRADLAFAAHYPEGAAQRGKQLVDQALSAAPEQSAVVREGEGYAVVALREHEDFTESIEAAVAAAADVLFEQRELVSVFLAFEPGDAAMHTRVRGRMRHPEAALLFGTEDFNDSCAVIGGARFVIAMRLHCTIIAAAQGVPGVGLSYNVKVAEVYRRLGMQDSLLPLDATDAQLTETCLRLADGADEAGRRVAEAAAREAQQADTAFSDLAEIVESHEAQPVRQYPYPRTESGEARSLKQKRKELKAARSELDATRTQLHEAQSQLQAAQEENERLKEEAAQSRKPRFGRRGR